MNSHHCWRKECNVQQLRSVWLGVRASLVLVDWLKPVGELDQKVQRIKNYTEQHSHPKIWAWSWKKHPMQLLATRYKGFNHMSQVWTFCSYLRRQHWVFLAFLTSPFFIKTTDFWQVLCWCAQVIKKQQCSNEFMHFNCICCCLFLYLCTNVDRWEKVTRMHLVQIGKMEMHLFRVRGRHMTAEWTMAV